MQERWKGSRLGFLPVGPLHSLQPLLQPQVVAEAPLLARECALRVSGQAAVSLCYCLWASLVAYSCLANPMDRGAW